MYAQRLAGLRSWRDALGEDALRAPAYLVDAAFVSPESELEALRYILSQSRASTLAFAERCREADGGLLPQHAAWVHDFELGHQAVLGLVGAACSYVAAQRMQPLRAFCTPPRRCWPACATTPPATWTRCSSAWTEPPRRRQRRPRRSDSGRAGAALDGRRTVLCEQTLQSRRCCVGSNT